MKERRHAACGPLRRGRGPALLGRREEGRKVELLVAGIQRCEEIEHLLLDLEGPLVRPVDLVDDDDGVETQRQRLGEHEPGLGHGTFGCVHEHEDAVHHVEHPLDLAAEIGMAGRVDDIDLRPFPDDRRALGKNGDAALAFEFVRIERPFGDPLVVAKRARLTKQNIHQCRLAMIDMGDDRNIA